jgi:hypothetical protein
MLPTFCYIISSIFVKCLTSMSFFLFFTLLSFTYSPFFKNLLFPFLLHNRTLKKQKKKQKKLTNQFYQSELTTLFLFLPHNTLKPLYIYTYPNTGFERPNACQRMSYTVTIQRKSDSKSV